MTSTSYMMRLVRSVFPYGKPFEPDKNVSHETLKQIFITADKQDMTHLVSAALSPSNQNPSLDRIKLTAVYRRQQLDTETERVCTLLEREGIDHIPLKGAVISKYYPEAWMRTSCDVDILVKREDLDKAITAITSQLDYEDLGRDYHDHRLRSKNATLLELHFSLEENSPDLDKVLSHAWEYATLADGSSHRYAFDDEFLLFHLIAHTQYHFLSGGCGVKPFLDLWVLKNTLSFDEQKLQALLDQSGSKLFYQGCLRLVDVWFEDAPHDTLTSQMEQYILSGGAYGTLSNRASAKGGKLKYIISRTFLSKKELTAYFPPLETKPYLLPYYQLKRWTLLLRKKHLPTLNTQNTQDISSMLDTLGL